ncbi:unnamed protein product [Candida verbasci]|uniref:Tr-type G domain-containing protein n=1 Tax=Candida verbasci TaxID=1227364 RepID=A0A9W4TVK2_9ASCO|nr:unnamed protein product [Candida verbasci]
MDDDDMYDEFGNYLGGDQMDSDDESIYLQEKPEQIPSQFENNTTALIKHDVNINQGEIIYVQPNDSITEQPVIQPNIERSMKVEIEEEETDSNLKYSSTYLKELMNNSPERIRNVSILGNTGSGKTSLIDQLIYYTHKVDKKKKNLRYLDNHKLEIDREMSIKASSITLLLPDVRDKSHVINIIDTPGHVDFNDEVLATLHGVEGVILVLDAVEGLTTRDEILIHEIVKLNLPITLILNKIDSLILELRLPPNDTYLKLETVIEDVNECIRTNEHYKDYIHKGRISPEFNNVFFSSAKYEFIFNLKSFTKMYSDNQESKTHEDEFLSVLWGDYYLDEENGSISSYSNKGKLERSFVSFILNPIYKIVTYTLTHETGDKRLSTLLWENSKLKLHKKTYNEEPQMLLKTVFNNIFSDYGNKSLVVTIQKNVTSPLEVTKKQGIEFTSTIGQVLKLVESSNGKKFSALVRLYKGSLKTGDKVKVYGENYNIDKENFKIETITRISIPQGRSDISINEVSTGNIVLIEGIDSIIKKGATITDINTELAKSFSILAYSRNSVFKVAVEPYKPSELPLLLDALRKIDKSYLSSIINVEENGEHIIIAPGELYMDCILHDVRLFFNDELQIRVSDPMVKFSETCIDMSFTKIPIKINNMAISVIAEPINDAKLIHNLETERINMSQTKKEISTILKTEHGWDVLAARSLWSISSDLNNPSILQDDTLEGESDKTILNEIKELVVTGFQWGVNEGPLINEPIRNVKFKILDFITTTDDIQINSAQIIPIVRNSIYTALLLAQPRLLEPVYKIITICTYKSIKVLEQLLNKRRGYIDNKREIPGTPLFEIIAYVLAIDSFGFHSDLKFHSQKQAKCQLVFDGWEIVPGDPLDETKQVSKLKPVDDEEALSRDFMVKTRKRKGITGEPTVQKYIDNDIYIKLKERNLIQ